MNPKLSHQFLFLHVIWTRVGLSLTTVTFPISNSLLNAVQMKQRMSITSLWDQLILWFMFPSSTQLSVMHLQYIEKWLRESWVGPRNKGSSISKLLEHVHCKTENTLQQLIPQSHAKSLVLCNFNQQMYHVIHTIQVDKSRSTDTEMKKHKMHYLHIIYSVCQTRTREKQNQSIIHVMCCIHLQVHRGQSRPHIN